MHIGTKLLIAGAFYLTASHFGPSEGVAGEICHLGDLQYSQGIKISIADTDYTCSEAGAWQIRTTSDDGAGCVYASQVYSNGAIIHAGNRVFMICEISKWTLLDRSQE